VAGVLLFFEFLPEVANLLSLPGDRVPALSLAGIQAAVALGTLGVLLWLIARHRLTAATREPLALLFVLNGGLFFIAAMVRVYEAARTEARFTIVQAIVLLAALLWDTLMSGEAITNVEGTIFPRHTRVLLFLGYIMLVSSAVLYFSSWQLQATNASTEPFFESEQWPQYGLIGLGVPLLIAGFMMQVGRSLGEQHTVEEGAAGIPEAVGT
jgi:hypothetical protein